MTSKTFRIKKRMAAGGFSVILLFFIFLLLKNPSLVASCIGQGLSLCAKTIIPALFPFIVLSELLISCGFGEFFGNRLGRPLAVLFGISKASSAAVFLGFLCGFPVGAKMAVGLYDRGCINKSECERLLGFCNLPSIAFLVSAVGISLYHNHSFGIFLWLSSMLSSVVVGILTKKKKEVKKQVTPVLQPPLNASLFTSAITNASVGILSICSYILFFSTVLGCLSQILSVFHAPPLLKVLLYGFCELTSGVDAATTLTNRFLSVFLCGLSVGWSGLSVHCQLMTLCDGRGLSYRFYFLSRLAESLICAFLVLLFSPFYF